MLVPPGLLSKQSSGGLCSQGSWESLSFYWGGGGGREKSKKSLVSFFPMKLKTLSFQEYYVNLVLLWNKTSASHKWRYLGTKWMQTNVLFQYGIPARMAAQETQSILSVFNRSYKKPLKIRLLCPFPEVTQKATKLKMTDDSYEFFFLGIYKHLRYFCFGLRLTFTQSCAEGVYIR